MIASSFDDMRRLGALAGVLLCAVGAIACSEEPGQQMVPVTAGAGGVAGNPAMTPAAGSGAVVSGSGAVGPTGAAGSAPDGAAASSGGVAGALGAAGSMSAAGSGGTWGSAEAGAGPAGHGAEGAAGMGDAAGAGGAAGVGAAGGGAAGAGDSGSGEAGSGAAGSSEAGAGAEGAAAGSGGMGGAVSGATFTEVYSIISAGCSCHGNGSGGLSTRNKMTAYMNLVDASSRACSGEQRVVPGDPDKSVLMHTLDRTMLGNCRVPPMPQNAAKLPQADLDKVRSWIQAGAKND